MRLFVAVRPPQDALDHLDIATSGVPPADVELRWTLGEQRHVTVAFLGEVEEGRLPGLTRRLARAAARHPPAVLRLAGAGTFGSVRRARVLWAGLRGDVAALRSLAQSVTAAARRERIELETRRFRPHLTLARTREPGDLAPVVEALAAYAGPSWTAGRIELLRSHLGQGPRHRARHETLDSWELTGRPAGPVERARRDGRGSG